MSDERIKKIAEFYGKESQLDILQEECAELVQAISKYRRGGSYQLTLEEIADVEIVIEQIKYLNTDAENRIIEKIRDGKLDRQIQRIIIQQEANNVKPCSSCTHFNNGNRKPYPCGSCFINSHNMWEEEND